MARSLRTARSVPAPKARRAGWSPLDVRAADTARLLAADAVQNCGNGHPGTAMSLAPVAYLLYQNVMRHDPADPQWLGRDRFVLSCGHSSLTQYVQLYLSGYGLELSDLKALRTWGSLTPGHPEVHHTAGVEITTGPLGSGLASAVGMAMAQRRQRALLDPEAKAGESPFDHHIWVLASDGDLMEGVSGEASSLAGHHELGNLTVVYDANRISIEDDTEISFSEDVAARYAAYGWEVVDVDWRRSDSPLAAGEYVEDIDALYTALNRSRATKRPTTRRSEAPRSFSASTPARASPSIAMCSRTLAEFASGARPHTLPGTRRMPRGAAPSPSARPCWIVSWQANSTMDGQPSFIPKSKQTHEWSGSPLGRTLHFGIREFAMGLILNGIALEGLTRPYGGTFLVFSDYMRASVRLAAIQKLPVTFVWTHDSIGLGEDGPTHQPIEHIASLRLIPDFDVVRPADANETAAAWAAILRNRRPAGLALSRQNLPVLERGSGAAGSVSGVAKGAYILRESSTSTPEVILIGTGSEVHLALAARETLEKAGIGTRVVSMPCQEWFTAQSAAYREKVLPAAVKARVSVEAGVPTGWREWVGDAGRVIGIDHFGASADGDRLMREFGFTVEAVVAAAESSIAAASAAHPSPSERH